MQRDLLGRTAIVTGGSRGIGREIAKRLATDGADVLLTYATRVDAAKAAAQETRALSKRQIHVRPCDVTKPEDIRGIVDFAAQVFGVVDILVNNAGVMKPCDPIKFDLSEARRVMDINVFGPARFVAETLPLMQKNGQGRVINISSTVSLIGSRSSITYGMSKAALNAMTASQAVALGRYGITVNAIAPSTIRGEMYDSLPRWRRQEIERGTPVGRPGWPQEVASVVAFLASDDAAFINGQIIIVDGGRTIWVPGQEVA